MGEVGEKLAECYRPKGDDFLTPEELRALTPEVLIARTRALKPKLRARAAEAERLRRPVDELWDELRRTGYFYMLVPKKYGGMEADIDTMVDATLPLAEGCPSTGWVAMFAMNHNRNMVAYPEKGQDEFFGGGRYIIEASGTLPFGTAERVPGGFRVSGHWKWATCITQADWCQVYANVQTENGPKVATFMIRAEDFRVIDTWNTDGMRATGTHDIACENVFVPDHRTNTEVVRDGTGRGAELYENPIFRVPLSPLLAFVTAVPTIGAARAAVDMYREKLESHTKRGTDVRQAEKQASQIRLARADVMVRTADILVRETMKKNLVGTTLTGDAQIPFRNALRAQISYVAELCKQAVLMVCESTGTSIHYLDNPMQRHLRDIMVMTSHIIFDPDVVFEQHGRSMLGLPPTSIIL